MSHDPWHLCKARFPGDLESARLSKHGTTGCRIETRGALGLGGFEWVKFSPPFLKCKVPFVVLLPR
jgi:hypothetical protein